MNPKVIASLAAVSLIIASCSSVPVRQVASDRAANPKSDFAYCPVTSVGKTDAGTRVLVCDRLYLQRPYLQLPPAKQDGRKIVIEGILNENSDQFKMTTTQGDFLLTDRKSESPQGLPKLGRQIQRTHFTIYRAEGLLDKEDDRRIIVESVRPVVIVSSCAMEGLFAGTWSAKAAARTSNSYTYSGKGDLPMHITIRRLETSRPFEDADKAFAKQDPEKYPLKNGAVVKMVGTLDNLNQSITADGIIYPSLVDHGQQNPFVGVQTNEVQLYRLPSMHALGTLNFVMKWPSVPGISELGMDGGSVVLALRNLIQNEDNPRLSQATILPHGARNGFKITNLKLLRPGDYSLSCPDRTQ